VTHLGDPGIDLEAGKLPALAGLGALRHLDLEFVGVDEVFAGDAEAARRDLLDGAAARSPVSGSGVKRLGSSPPSPVLDLPPMRFIAMASVSWALGGDRAEAHRAGAEALDDFAAGSTSSRGMGCSASLNSRGLAA
jgi:hypothetical protein